MLVGINMLVGLTCVAMMASCARDQAPEGPKAGVMDWSNLVRELTGAEYYRGIVTPETKPFLVAFESGLTDEEVAPCVRRVAAAGQVLPPRAASVDSFPRAPTRGAPFSGSP